MIFLKKKRFKYDDSGAKWFNREWGVIYFFFFFDLIPSIFFSVFKFCRCNKMFSFDRFLAAPLFFKVSLGFIHRRYFFFASSSSSLLGFIIFSFVFLYVCVFYIWILKFFPNLLTINNGNIYFCQSSSLGFSKKNWKKDKQFRENFSERKFLMNFFFPEKVSPEKNN